MNFKYKNFKIKKCAVFMLTFMFCLSSILICSNVLATTAVVQSNLSTNSATSQNIQDSQIIQVPDIKMPEILSESAYLMDSSSSKVLYSKAETEKRYPASTTKIVTAIIALENCKLDDIVTVPYEAISNIPSGYSIADLRAGEELTMEQVLELLLVHSANDAANIIAYHISGSIESFATLMNQKVNELGLTNTHFTNPSGIHNKDHYTTAYDLAKIMQYCMKNANFRKLAGLPSCTIPATNKHEERTFKSTDDLVIPNSSNSKYNYYYKYAVAGKTGYTSEAKNCLVSCANKDGFELICVVLSVGSYAGNVSGRFTDTKTLYDFAYNNYIIRKLNNKNDIITQIEIKNGSKDTKNLDLLAANDISALIPQDNLNTEYQPQIELNSNLYAPIAYGQVVGKVTYNINGDEYSSDLIASHNVEISGFFKIVIRIILITVILYLLYKILSSENKKSKKKKYKGYYRNYKKNKR